MKTSKFQKWSSKQLGGNSQDNLIGWNASLKKVISLIERRNKIFEGNWQHEDIDYLLEDIKEMLEK